MNSKNGDSSVPNDEAAPARRRPVRSLPDLASLCEAVDQSRPLDLGALAPRTAPENPPQAESASPPAQAPARRLPDLSLLDDFKTPSKQPAGRPGSLPEEAVNGLAIQPDLEKYIYPDLWRKLNGPSPSRGILINVLDHVRSTFNLLSTFLPQHLVQEKMRRAVPGLVSGQMLHGTLLFSDVSGFTTLSERLQGLGPKGAELMTKLMNRYFGQMLEILARSGGTLLKFAGDAMLVFFPGQEQDEQANWAVRAGQRMLLAMKDFADLESPGGKVSLKMKIGLATGDFLAASVGSAQRMEYVVLGQAVLQTMTAESLTTAAGQMVINAQTAPHLSPAFPVSEHKNGYFRVTPPAGSVLDEFEIKAETRRARGAISWDASPNAIMAQVDVTLRQIKAILPYLSPEVVERMVIHGQRSLFPSQFRPTTVLFCNFWGFEELLAGWGEEGVTRVTGLLNAYFNAMSEVVTRFGGMISRIDPYSKGTKMLILFGAPVAHEDDPQRAVSAALAMNAELDSVNEAWSRKLARHLPPGFNGPLIQHRIGITTGNTFAGQVGSPTRREYTVMGDDVNLSARLMSAAGAGQILLSLSADNQAQMAASFHLSDLAPIRVKGKSKPVAVFQVQGPREDLLTNRAHERGPLIGRRIEWARAETLLNQASAGHGTLLILEGPAGIGKSHLADALIQRAEASGLRALPIPCRSYASETPYHCWSLLLRQLAGIGATDYQPQVHHARLRRLVQGLGLAEELVQPLAMLMGLKPLLSEGEDAGEEGQAEGSLPADETAALARQVRQGLKKRQSSRLDIWDQLDDIQSSETGQVWQPIQAQLAGTEREKVYAAVRALLDALARSRDGLSPLGLIFFEDAHWMDAASQDLLQWIEARLKDLPLLVLAARRKGDEKNIASMRAQTIALAPLNADDTRALVSDLLIADLAPVIHEQSQGNPLFVEEITRWYKRTHRISPEELRSVLQTSDILQKLILSHLESLPDELQEVAMAAAVIGNEFRTGEVQALLSGVTDAVTLSNHLRALARSHLVALAEAGADARYIFQQSLVRDVLYNSLPFEKRRELHGKLGDYLSRPLSRRRELQAHLAAALDANAANPAQAAETIAAHFERAERWPDAARQFWLAGDQARQQKDAGRASASFTRGLAAIDRLPAETLTEEVRQLRSRFHLAQGDLALKEGAYLPALTSYEMARSTLDPAAAPEFNAALVFRFALVLPTQRRAEEAETQLRALLDQPGFTPGLEFLVARAWLARRSGRPDVQQCLSQCVLRPGETGGMEEPAMRALVLDLGGDWASAREAYLSASCPAGAAAMSILQGQRALEQGEPGRALEYFRMAQQTEQPANGYPCAALALYRQAEVRWREGQVESARGDLERVRSFLEQAPPRMAAEGFAAVRNALKAIHSSKPGKWPNWSIQDLADQYTISLLFNQV